MPVVTRRDTGECFGRNFEEKSLTLHRSKSQAQIKKDEDDLLKQDRR